ncbi:hypothetical protein [Amycolatopsis cihanbeyliensis]|uniref:Very-short-patch-repair endonuclease n=1 Tax=Amycolatopsis cihanbeyliensis TaxID=1128664 RepID=A0A542DJN1_AMYCI|nr:hypothetical protein [Amycolatopsis cihanbeyliensis]TQJ03155.1 hypothetical protein FB471_2905 [Amycolatopsis cihanbeyliensis]
MHARPHELTDVFRGSEARREGLVTEGQLRGPAFRRLFQDVYVPSGIPVTHELRCRGAALIVPKEAVLTGRSAATVRGVQLAKTHDPVEFVVPEEFRFGPIKGMHVRRTKVTKKESRPWRGVRIARPARIALDLMLRLSPRTHNWIRRLRIAVPDIDAFLRTGLVRRHKLTYALLRRRNRGIRLARNALALADPRAESLPESELRIVLTAGGLTPTPQHKIRKNGRVIARLDLAIAEHQVAVEYDGRWHLKPDQIRHDRERRRRLTAEGWRFVIVDAELLAGSYQKILDLVRRAMGSP